MKLKSTSYLLIFMFSSILLSAQQLVGPLVVGAVDHNSARIYGIFDEDLDVLVILSDIAGQVPPSTNPSFILDPDPAKDLSAKGELTGLDPDTRYYVWVLDINTTTVTEVGSFKTFPLPNTESTFNFVYGSCISNFSTDSIFNNIASTDPAFVIIGGDWGYPDTTDDLPNDPSFFPTNMDWVRSSYLSRYSSSYFSSLAYSFPIDYMYDDHDYMNNNASGNTVTWIDFSLPDTLVEVDIPIGARTNIINGYQDHFPHYDLPNFLKGIYHSFKHGNAEFFVLDTRSNRTPISEGMYHNGTEWVFEPAADRTLLGIEQMEWLLDGLGNSQAHWKFIVSSVVFNQQYEIFRDSLLTVASTTPALESLAIDGAYATLDSWSGYEADQIELLNFIEEFNVENVIVLSGDSHTGAIDNGLNSGLPEMMAANLNQNNSQLAYFMQSLGGIELWNQGGQGLGNTNFENIFGNIEVFGNDSVCMNIVDVNDVLVARYCKKSCDELDGSTIGSVENLTCFDSADGSINGITVNGGLGETLYSIDGGPYALIDSFQSLDAGTYAILIQDEIGCIGELEADIFAPSEINPNLETGDQGQAIMGYAEVIPSGGTPPYNVAWYDDAGVLIDTEFMTDLTAGEYSVVITDDNDCDFMETFTIGLFNSVVEHAYEDVSIVQTGDEWLIHMNEFSLLELKRAKLLNLQGQLVEIMEINNTETSISKAAYPLGNYILHIEYKAGHSQILKM